MSEIVPSDFPEIRWRGNWIWVEPSVPGGMFGEAPDAHRPEAHGLFRKSFTLERVPERVPARITADSRYALFVNGREAYRGPIRSQPRRLHYDLLDLAPYLQAGTNVLAALVVYYGSPRSFWMPAAPNVTLGRNGVLVFEADLGKTGWLVSDSSWRAHKCDAWSEDWKGGGESVVSTGVPLEIVDARRLPHGWEQPGFDDRGWGTANLVPAVHLGGWARTQPPTDPYGPLYPRPIAKLGGERRTPATVSVEYLTGRPEPKIGDPVKRLEAALGWPAKKPAQASRLPLQIELERDGSARVCLDMGTIVMGHVEIEVHAPAGTELDLSYTEDPLLHAAPMLGMHSGTRYITRGSDDRFTVSDSLGFRYAYLLIHGKPGKLALDSFAVQEDVYPWQPGAEFRCSDKELERIFKAGIRTVQLNSRDAFTDCPTREQRTWVGDSVVHQMVHLATNPDWRLAWHFLTIGDSPRSDGILPMSVVGEIEWSGGLTIPDWSLHWLHGLHNRYRFSGDRDAVKAHMPTAERILRWYVPFQTSAGLLKDLVEWNLVDWASVSNEDTSAIITALWARGLKEFSEMAAWLEEGSSRRWADELYRKAKSGFEAFWDERRGSYADHIKDGALQPEMSQLAGALAIVSDLAPRERWARIIRTITDPATLVVRSWTGGGGEYSGEKIQRQFRGIFEIDWDAHTQVVMAQPFMSYTVHDAVAAAGEAARLPELCRRWSQFLTDGYDTIGECWGWGTHVHGWSCTPTRDLVFYVLGVTPAEPGYATARIAPRLGDLAWVEGKVPTPHGLIGVRASPQEVTVDSPVPIAVELVGRPAQSLPAGKHRIRTA